MARMARIGDGVGSASLFIRDIRAIRGLNRFSSENGSGFPVTTRLFSAFSAPPREPSCRPSSSRVPAPCGKVQLQGAFGPSLDYLTIMAARPMEIEYNEALEPLEKLLAQVRRAGDFQCHGTRELPMPRIEVQGVGVLSIPVLESQAQALIRQAVQAPYGRGTETIVDPNVRRVWQLSPDQARISGKSWPANFDAILSRVTTGLGCEGWTVSAELYKILVYEAGGFFVSHRDTEKAEGMFGTLVLVLPSAHQGGELVLRHAGQEVTVDMAALENSEIGFVAFYADCEHELRPVIAGHRVCLVYNLLQSPGAAGDSAKLLAIPDESRAAEAAAGLLESAFAGPGAPVKIAWLLEHYYSPDGLSFAALKAADRARAEVLLKAAQRSGCTAHLGIVHLEQSGDAEPYLAPSYRRSRHAYQEDASANGAAGKFEILDVSYSDKYIDQWRDRRDQCVEMDRIPLQPGELLPDGALDGVPPDEQRLTEATGNEGSRFERSYHRAAIVIWRTEAFPQVLLQAGASAALPYLTNLLNPAEGGVVTAEARSAATDLARRMVETWPAAVFIPYSQMRVGKPSTHSLLEQLVRLGDVELLDSFVERNVVIAFDGQETPTLIKAARLLGPETAATRFTRMLMEHAGYRPGLSIQFLGSFADFCASQHVPAWSKAFCQLAAALITGLTQRDLPARFPWAKPEPDTTLAAADMATLLRVLESSGVGALVEPLIEKVRQNAERFDPLELLTPTLELLGNSVPSNSPRVASFLALWTGTVDFLLQRSEHPPVAPPDWRRTVKLSCKCEVCAELQAFILDPVATVHRFRVRQELRHHLDGMIQSRGLEMTSITDRIGSPQTLVCTKNRREYDRRCRQYQKDIAALNLLAGLVESDTPKPLAILARISAAAGRSQKWSPA